MSASATAHLSMLIYSLPLVHRPKGVYWYVYVSRSIFDPIKHQLPANHFLDSSEVRISKTASLNEIEPLPSYSPIKSEQDGVSVHLDRIITMYGAPERNVTLIKEVFLGQTMSMTLIDTGNGQGTASSTM